MEFLTFGNRAPGNFECDARILPEHSIAGAEAVHEHQLMPWCGCHRGSASWNAIFDQIHRTSMWA